MIDYEAMAQKHAEGVIECNPDAENAKGLIATTFISGYLEGSRGEGHMNELNFGQALQHLKMGHNIARQSWGFKGMFLWLKPAGTIKAEWCKDPVLKCTVDAYGGELEALGTICMLTERKEVLSGWTPTQPDILAEDWYVV